MIHGKLAGAVTGGIVGEDVYGLDITGSEAATQAAAEGRALSEQGKADILGELGESWEDISGYMQPYLDKGGENLRAYKTAIGAAPDAPVFENFDFDASKMEQNPAYQFVRDQAMQGVNRAAAANRGLTSGNRMTALQDRAAGLASAEYGNEFQRQLQTYGANRQTKGMNFDVRNLLNRQKVGDMSNLLNMNTTTASNMSSLRQNLSNQRAGAYSNYAAEQMSANLLPIQAKQNFLNNLMGAGGAVAGGFLAGK